MSVNPVSLNSVGYNNYQVQNSKPQPQAFRGETAAPEEPKKSNKGKTAALAIGGTALGALAIYLLSRGKVKYTQTEKQLSEILGFSCRDTKEILNPISKEGKLTFYRLDDIIHKDIFSKYKINDEKSLAEIIVVSKSNMLSILKKNKTPEQLEQLEKLLPDNSLYLYLTKKVANSNREVNRRLGRIEYATLDPLLLKTFEEGCGIEIYQTKALKALEKSKKL